VLVAGATAHYVDLQHSLGSDLPLALAIVAALTIVILFVMTLILPLKQILMNALTLGAMFGIPCLRLPRRPPRRPARLQQPARARSAAAAAPLRRHL
jgi:uncharacterized membrane protein YdfJ with MMPL/SSD domain